MISINWMTDHINGGEAVISGPLAPVFGNGIRDVPVHTVQRNGYLSHTLYCSTVSWSDEAEPHIAELRKAIALG